MGGALMRELGHSQDEIDNWMMEQLEFVDNQEVYNRAQNISETQGYDAAIKWTMNQDIDTNVKRKIVSDINFEYAQQQDRIEIQQEVDRDEISKLIRSGQSATARIENSLLDEKEQWTWFERERAESERLAKDEPIATDYRTKGELESMAYDIPTGVVSMPEFKKELDGARWPVKGKPSIDDSTYDELFSLAERKFESYQSQAMKERELFALGQLVRLPSEDKFARAIEGLTPSEQEHAQTIRQLEFDNHDKYKKALRDWQKKNPDADADEIYTEGRRLLKHFRKSTEQLQKESQTVYPAIKPEILDVAKKVVSGKKTKLTDIPAPKDKREFINKLRELETIDPDLSAEYYNKYLDRFW
jgi:hypothetical protein